MWLKLSCLVITVIALTNGSVIRDGDLDWWKTATFYQIYPRSFKDSNNDGIGDVKGIISKLDYLANIGVTGIWLSPIFKSPQVDQGYDISDYYSIEPDYGTMEDVRTLIARTKELGMKIILDFVPNHTSDQHVWFNKSIHREAGYEDYYLWDDGKKDESGKIVGPPNNWISVFKGSAWTWNEIRQQYFFHQFAPAQPDLNYHSETLVQAMKGVLTFWLDEGVDGFRIDAIPHMFEDKQLRDEPRSNNPTATENDYDYLEHIYTKDQPETYDIIYDWRRIIDDYTKTRGGDQRVLMAEAYTTFNNTLLYFGTEDGSKLGAHFAFNFDFLSLNQEFTANQIYESITRWLSALPNMYTPNWVLGNHDNHRLATRVGKQFVDSLNMLVGMLPGIQVTYNGEEIGMENGNLTCAEGKDPSAIKDCSTFDLISRDFERTPFQWDNSANGGFNEGAETWLPVSEKYKETNVELQELQEQTGVVSHLQIYTAIQNLRKQFGEGYQVELMPNNILHISRDGKKACCKNMFQMFNNLGREDAQVESLGKEMTVIMASVGSQFSVGQTVNPEDNFTLKSAESVIFKNCPCH